MAEAVHDCKFWRQGATQVWQQAGELLTETSSGDPSFSCAPNRERKLLPSLAAKLEVNFVWE